MIEFLQLFFGTWLVFSVLLSPFAFIAAGFDPFGGFLATVALGLGVAILALPLEIVWAIST